MTESASPQPEPNPPLRRRRRRYAGKYPRRFEEKYKEHDSARYVETVAKVLAAGKTPAGSHRPIMVDEVLEVLAPAPGALAVDCTLGYGGHALELLKRILPGGRLIGLDADPLELPKTEARLRALGYGAEVLQVYRSNFAGLAQILATQGLTGADVILADLGVSSMQLDDPTRGFSFKHDGPLDMRMNPDRGEPASAWLARIDVETLRQALGNNADETHAEKLATALAGRLFPGTRALAQAIRTALRQVSAEDVDLAVRRVFQALRIAVNEEFSALDAWLRQMPHCLLPAGRVAVLTFHSGEDRRVKKAFQIGLASGVYSTIADEVIRPTPAERHANPRSAPAKLRWARLSG